MNDSPPDVWDRARRRTGRSWAVVGTLLFLVSGCDLGTESRRKPDAVLVSPTTILFDAVQDVVTLSAEVLDREGLVMEGVTVHWTSSDPLVADVSADGVVTSVGNGSASIQATVSSVSGTAAASVNQIPISIAVASGESQNGAAGEPLDDPVEILVLDRLGVPAEGIEVSFVIPAGGGSSSPSTVTTGTDGIAATTWELGTLAGATQMLEASVPGTALETSTSADAQVGPPAEVRKISGDDQTGPRTSALPLPLVVLVIDRFENPVSGMPITWTISQGGGTIGPVSATTDAAGFAFAEWVLGNPLGQQTLEVGVAGLEIPAVFSATAVAVPEALEITSGDNQTATVGEATPIPPRVRVVDGFGFGVAQIPVTFTIESGGGSLIASGSATQAVGVRENQGPSVGADASVGEATLTVPTDPLGFAEVGAWVLGTTAGTNRVRADVNGHFATTFEATGTAGTAAILEKVTGDGQTGTAGAALGSPLVARVRDAFGNPRAGTVVQFLPNPGSGAASPSLDVSDAAGLVSTSWTLGATEGPQQLAASFAVAAPVTFGATSVEAGGGDDGCASSGGSAGGAGFDIELAFVVPVCDGVLAAFESAVERWTEIIVDDISDIGYTLNAGEYPCFADKTVSKVFDDLYVEVRVAPDDGPGNRLGFAGPCLIRNSSALPLIGTVSLDEADVNGMLADGRLEDVIVHELGHILGIGTIWQDLGYLEDPATPGIPGVEDTHFDGPLAVAAFDASGGAGHLGAKVPVENVEAYGQGTYNGHWRESVLGNELMTGFINGGSNPLSRITIASMADLGYGVDLGMGDPYSVPSAALKALGEPPTPLGERLIFPTTAVAPDGTVYPVAPPPAP